MNSKNLIFTALSLLFISTSCTKKDDRITVGYMPIAECVQLYVAKDMGYFDKYNVQVELISMAGGSEILNALNSNSVDVGFSNVVSLVLHKAQGSKFFSVFGGTMETSFNQNHALLINKKKQKQEMKSTLNGAKISVNTFKNIEELMMRKYLKKYGLTWDDVEKVEIAFPRMLPLLESGELTASCVVEPFITIASQDSNSLIVNVANQYLSTTPKTLVATYVSSQKSIDKKTQQLEGFIRAMEDATDYIKNNESEAREIIGNYTKIPKEMLPKIGLSEFLKTIDLKQLELVINDMVEFGYITNKEVPELSSFIYTFK